MISRAHPRAIAIAAALGALGTSATAFAQEETLNARAERFNLSLDREGILGVEWGAVPQHLSWDLSLWMGFANDPLVHYDGATDMRTTALVSQRIGGSLTGSLALFEWVQVGVTLPVVVAQSIEVSPGENDDDPDNVKDWASPNVSLKVRILTQDEQGVDLAIMPTVRIPVGRSDEAIGDSDVVFVPAALVSRSWGPLRTAMNLGYRMRDENVTLANDISVEDEMYASLGAAYRMSDAGGPPIEVDLTVSAANNVDDLIESPNNTELMGGLRYGITTAATAMLGAGIGLNDGYATPDWRVVFGFRWGIDTSPTPPPRVVPVPVVAQRGANATGDADKDLVVDGRDLCPGEAEDVDGFEDNDGCPDFDNDNDGTLDSADACPDTMGQVENKGCADSDKDQDRIVDRLDNCPDTVGPAANRGCPVDRTQLAFITDTRLEVANNVFFDKGTARIDARSMPLLDNVADILNAHPEIALLEVQGHVDELETRQKNLALSQKRAEAVVDYLAKKGVERKRLKAVGVGADHPLVSSDDERATELNRRVEFHIAEGADPEGDVKAGMQQPPKP